MNLSFDVIKAYNQRIENLGGKKIRRDRGRDKDDVRENHLGTDA